MKKIQPYTTVIWDMDGVIIDTEPQWAITEKEIFTSLGVPETEDFENSTVGLRTIDVINFWYQKYPWDLNKHPFDQVRTHIYTGIISFVRNHGTALPNVIDTMHFFAEKKVPQAIASSSSLEMIEAVITRLDIGVFISTYSSGENELHGKPAPDIYITTARKLDQRPEECLVIEDSLTGALAGSRARMQVYVVPRSETFADAKKMAALRAVPNAQIIRNLNEIVENFPLN